MTIRPEIWASILISFLGVLCVSAIAIYALVKGHDGVIVGSSSAAIGAICGWAGHRFLRPKGRL